MKRFRFRLQTLERLRKRERRAAQGQLAEAAGRCHEARSLLDRHRVAVVDAESLPSDNQHAQAPTTGKDWKQWAGSLLSRRNALQFACDQEQERSAELLTAREGYRDAARAHRLLTRLRETRHKRWAHEAELDETRFLSEIFLQRLAARRRDEAGD